MTHEDRPMQLAHVDRFERRAMELVARLHAVGQHEDAKTVDQVMCSLEHTRYWYAIRHERLWHWAHAELTEPQKTRYFSILANGTADVNEPPPTYAQQFTAMKFRMEEAERQLAALRSSQAGDGPKV
jgi:hypothetical protein